MPTIPGLTPVIRDILVSGLRETETLGPNLRLRLSGHSDWSVIREVSLFHVD